MEESKLTGYPSIDKPWLKYYSEEAIHAPLPECTMYEYIKQNNLEHPNDVAIKYFGRKITYKELIKRIDQTAGAFTHWGVKRGDVVTIQSLSLPQVIFSLYALSKIGAVANLIFANTDAKELKMNLNNTGSRVWVVMEPIFDVLKEEMSDADIDVTIVMSVQGEADLITKTIYSIGTKAKRFHSNGAILSWQDFYNTGKKTNVPVQGKNIDPVVMVYTGGTTGKSKAVVLSNFNINAGALQYLYLGFERGKTMLCALPPFIAFGITVTIHTPLSFGLSTALCVGKDITDIGKFTVQYKPNYIICGTAQLNKMMEALRNKKIDLSFLHCLSVGGDALPQKTEELGNVFLAAHNSKIHIAQGYAMSETSATAVASTRTIDHTVYKSETVGVPLIFTNVKIVDPDTGLMRKYNEIGEICLNGPCTMMGYYKDSQETDYILRIHDDGLLWVHTGDLGCIDEDGFISIAGRIKRMIMTFDNGIYHKVFPKLLEDEFLTIDGIKEISIVGKKHIEDPLINDLVAFVVMQDNVSTETVLERLHKFSKCKLEIYERPINYIFLPQLPRTGIGKIDYRALELETQKC